MDNGIVYGAAAVGKDVKPHSQRAVLAVLSCECDDIGAARGEGDTVPFERQRTFANGAVDGAGDVVPNKKIVVYDAVATEDVGYYKSGTEY